MSWESTFDMTPDQLVALVLGMGTVWVLVMLLNASATEPREG